MGSRSVAVVMVRRYVASLIVRECVTRGRVAGECVTRGRVAGECVTR